MSICPQGVAGEQGSCIESSNFEEDVARYCQDFYEFDKELIVVGTYDSAR